MWYICMCDQQRLRPACAYAQTDQSLCKSLEYYLTVKLLTDHHLEFLSLKGGCTGSSASTLVKMPHCWKTHVAAHMKMEAKGKISASRYVHARSEKMTLCICYEYQSYELLTKYVLVISNYFDKCRRRLACAASF